LRIGILGHLRRLLDARLATCFKFALIGPIKERALTIITVSAQTPDDPHLGQVVRDAINGEVGDAPTGFGFVRLAAGASR
jgi:hypothetical protein